MKLRESCGVFGITSNTLNNINVAEVIFQGLLALQHRGQESAGISIINHGRIHTYKGLGLVLEVFDPKRLKLLDGKCGIGHVRYSTRGMNRIENSQPMEFNSTQKFSLCFNGNIANYGELREKLESEGYSFSTTSDLEVIGYLISKYIKKGWGIIDSIGYAMQELVGSYSALLLLDNGALIAFRDKYGVKPLCIGLIDYSNYVFSSESSALDVVGAKFARDIPPGTIIVADDELLEVEWVKCDRHAHCMFEWVYFSRPDSMIEGISVYRVRYRLGEKLAELCNVDADVVIPVPETSRIAALGFSKRSGVPLAEGFGVNRYVWRTFIMPEDRGEYVTMKFNPIREVLKDKRVIMIDDSIVRGTTSKVLVSILRKAGAREVHLAVTCPPIVSPCYMGVDFPTYDELIACDKGMEDIRRNIGADSLTYMTIDGLIESIGIDESELCLACLTGVYPMEIDPKILSGRWVKE
ncbi:amidophosphoribosyltransferase [Candidatus Bathyarchaeota archaeon]|nr:amidophosphoribosyltransferase [Candidatus Bathyarchaeota archaeon]